MGRKSGVELENFPELGQLEEECKLISLVPSERGKIQMPRSRF